MSTASTDAPSQGCYVDAIPEYCFQVEWHEELPVQCVSCLDYNIHRKLYDLRHETSTPYTRDSLLKTIDNTVPLPIIGVGIIQIFAIFHALHASSHGHGSFSSLLSAGNGYVLRFVFGMAMATMIMNTVSMYYYSHPPNFTTEAVDVSDRLLPPNTSAEAFITTKWGRIRGWKSENSSFHDPLLLLFLVAFITTWLQVFAPGLPLTGHHFVFFFSLLFLAVVGIYWERISGMGVMWFTDILILIGVSLLACTGALGMYLMFYKAALYYESTSVRRELQQQRLAANFGAVAQDYFIYALVILVAALLFYLAYYVQHHATLAEDAYLVPSTDDLEQYTIYDYDAAIKVAKSKGQEGLPNYITLPCPSDPARRAKIYAGSKYSSGTIESQVRKQCS